MKPSQLKLWAFIGCFASLALVLFEFDRKFFDLKKLPSGVTLLGLAAVICGIVAVFGLANLVTRWFMVWRKRPAVEGAMVGRLYWLPAFLAIIVAIVYGFGYIQKSLTAFSLFGGMLLGWSLQAPVSGFAAWVLISLKRPFRPGDRVQFPNLGLTGDVKDIGPMYTVLNQVGGTIGSEEAVGRHILVPNAMLFGQVAINYTVLQDAPYMLDEVVVRITYDSDWKAAEHILLDAATEVTGDIIKATGEQPYMRADLYDYGVYMRLRYHTRVKERAEISYEINKVIFEGIQRTPSVDIAIPFVYSYRAVQDRKDLESAKAQPRQNLREIEISRIANGGELADPDDVELLMRSISAEGLLQPIVVTQSPGTDNYEILAGHLRFEACKKLGWKTIPALLLGRPSPLKPQPR